MEYKLALASQSPKQSLERFLIVSYPEPKSTFILNHGNWWYRGDQNQWVLLDKDAVIGYCAIIPTDVWIKQKSYPAIWKLDLMIAPEYRGKGLQSIFDAKIRENGQLLIGFPNQYSAKIHKKLGWGVRDDYEVLLLPLKPLNVIRVHKTKLLRKLLLRSVGLILEPIMWLYKIGVKSLTPNNVLITQQPDLRVLTKIFEKYKSQDYATTLRDDYFFQVRFNDSPYKDNLYPSETCLTS